jgi:hypothetical protein
VTPATDQGVELQSLIEEKLKSSTSEYSLLQTVIASLTEDGTKRINLRPIKSVGPNPALKHLVGPTRNKP